MNTDEHGSSQATEPLFIATARFDPSDGKSWLNYFQWVRIPALTEVVSLDCSLCERLVADFADEDWQHIINEDFRLHYFYHLDYLLSRVHGKKRRNILGLYRNPETHITKAPAAGNFSFIGYDLIEEQTQISALTNCGGFPDVFSNEELNSQGLLPLFERAAEVKVKLVEKHPEESHARCELYAIWRLNE
jgi:hypothetical protein